jgi:glycosyltransferase involved in cell wall biosynthesis
LKILQISSAQSLGGGETHLADLANGLAHRGHDVYVALRPNSPVQELLKDLATQNVFTLPLRNSLDARSARDLSTFVRRNEVRIVHAHMGRDYPLAAYAVRKNPQARLIITRHVLFPLSRLHRITLSRAARIIAVSQAVASQLRSDRIALDENISVVLNGIDVAKFKHAREKFDRRHFLQSWKLPEESLMVGIVGELTPLKGQEEFLRAAARILEQQADTYFVIAGIDHSPSNKNRTVLERLILELNLSNRVRLVGWLEDLNQLYCALDVFVSASHTESFGLAIAEAMASCTAVVATETAGAREVVRDGETGILVPIGEVESLTKGVLKLLADKALRIQLANNAQKAVSEQFSVERMIAETEEIYRTVLEGSAS